MDFIPEFIAGTAFLPSGVFMGYMFYIYSFSNEKELENVKYWPYIVAIISALCTSAFLYVCRYIKKREMYYHFYCIGVAAIFFIIGGIVFMNAHDGPSAMYISGVGHGITYVASLSYTNLRVAQKKAFRISLCHIRYFIGCAWAAQAIISGYANRDEYGNDTIYASVGFMMLVPGIALLILVLINEALQWCKVYDYKKSADDNVNSGKCYLNRSETIDSLKRANVPGWNLYFTKATKPGAAYWLLFTKLTGAVLFSNVMMSFAGTATLIYHQLEYSYFYGLQWTVLGGAIVGSIVLLKRCTKFIFQISNIIHIATLIAAIALFTQYKTLKEITIAMYVYYFFLGVSYNIADVSILEISSFKYTEIMLGIGYVIEILPIAILQYYYIYDIEAISMYDDINTFWMFGIVFILLAIALMIIVQIFLINTFQKSALQIMYEIWGINYVEASTVQRPLPTNVYQTSMVIQQPSAPVYMQDSSQNFNQQNRPIQSSVYNQNINQLNQPMQGAPNLSQQNQANVYSHSYNNQQNNPNLYNQSYNQQNDGSYRF